MELLLEGDLNGEASLPAMYTLIENMSDISRFSLRMEVEDMSYESCIEWSIHDMVGSYA